MEGKDKLNQLVQSARNEAPLVDLESISELLPVEGAAGSSTSSTSFFQLKNIVIMSSIIATSLLSLLFLWPGASNVQIAPAALPENTLTTHTETLLPTRSFDTDYGKDQVIIEKGEPLHPDMASQQEEVSGKCSLINPFFALSTEEWAALYATINEKHFTYSYISAVDSYYHSLQFNHNGKRIFTQRANKMEKTRMEDLLLPLGSSEINGEGFTNAQDNAYDQMESLQKEWQLIALKTPMKGDRVVWYHLNPELLDGLPERLKETLYTCVLQYSMEIRPKSKWIMAGKNPENALQGAKTAYSTKDAIPVDDIQMQELGFKLSKGRLELKGRVERGVIYFKCSGQENFQSSKNYDGKLPIIPAQSLKYVPLFVSRPQSNCLVYSYADHAREQQKTAAELFRTRRQGLLPLIYQPSFTDSSLVFWYEPSDQLLNTLGIPTEKQELLLQRLEDNLKEAELKYPDLSQVLELHQTVSNDSTSKRITLLEVPEETLKQLGISVENKTVVYREPGIESRFGKKELVSVAQKDSGRKLSWTTSAAMYMNEDKEMGTMTFTLSEKRTVHYIGKCQGQVSPKFVTDDLAQVWKMGEITKAFKRDMPFTGHNNYVDSMVAANTKNSYLIPILVRSGGKYSRKDEKLGHQRPDCIFWYEPSDSFFNLLPRDLGQALKTEITIGSKEQDLEVPFTIAPSDTDTGVSQTPCQYFEVCKTQRLAIENHAVFPNPTTDQLNVTIKSLEDCEGTISITSISGKMIAQTPIVLEEGLSQQFSFSLKGIQGGIYLVNVQTDQGDQISQRIIKLE